MKNVKIRVNEKMLTKVKKTLTTRIKLPKTLRMTMLLVLGLIFIFSLFNVNAAYQEPDSFRQSKFNYSYAKEGDFDYTIYLENNTIYDNKTTLPPGGKAFRQLVDHIECNFTYSFSVSEPAEIKGTYELIALLQTDIWTKTYTLIPKKEFSTTGSRTSFTLRFPIDYKLYENIVTDIDAETGVTAPNPQLIIQCNIKGEATTEDEVIKQDFSPSINVPLNTKIIELNEPLTNRISFSDTDTDIVDKPEVENERAKWGNLSILCLVLIFVGAVITKNDTGDLTKTDRMVNKIIRKYGEWIVEIDKLPKRPIGAEIIKMKTLDDLIKTSEELGKPIIHYSSNVDNTHMFYVLDNNIHYEHILTENAEITKTVICPKCGARIDCKGKFGETVHLECPMCGKKGTIDI